MSADQYVLFTLRDQIYGIEISKIREVMSYRKVTPLPKMKGFIKGIINLRGIIVPVFDIREKFDLPAGAYTPYHVIIVMEIMGRVMGIVADEIADVLMLSPDELQTTTNLPPGMHSEYLKGIGNRDQDLIILLNMDRLLSHDELESLDAT
jgi:purine-binding chemotaxis protein CheW